ncbi:MAG: adenylyltransferase/cytidyltransferase family protein [Draconibacterium sp.]|nr:adenylyltransferase/cytidyltransferase family protein [Draconibacterium sp.]
MQINTKSKIYSNFLAFGETLKKWKANNETIVFTNGCFDIIHHGHVDSLQKSAELGTKLIVGLNSDESVNILKGKNRPVFDVEARSIILAAFEFVDAVIVFYDDTPAELIAQIIPDVLVKGKQYKIHEIAGHKAVLNNGGKVITLELVAGISTSDLIDKIKTLD